MPKAPKSVLTLTTTQVVELIRDLPDDMLDLPVELQMYCKFLAKTIIGINPSMTVFEVHRKEREYYALPAKDQVSFVESVRSILIQVLLAAVTESSVKANKGDGHDGESDKASAMFLTVLTMAIHHNEYVANRHNRYEFVPNVDDHPLAQGIREYLKKKFPTHLSWAERNP